jgi:hypothetical protein
MHTCKLEIELPGDITGYLQMDNEEIKSLIYRLLLYDLVRRGVISSGKAAELAGVDKMSFITDMGHMGIPYFDGNFSEVLKDAETVGQTMRGLAQ